MKSYLKGSTNNFKNLSTCHSENLCGKKIDDQKRNRIQILLISQVCSVSADPLMTHGRPHRGEEGPRPPALRTRPTLHPLPPRSASLEGGRGISVSPAHGASGSPSGHALSPGSPRTRSPREPPPPTPRWSGPRWAAQAPHKAQGVPCALAANAPGVRRAQAGGEGAGPEAGRTGLPRPGATWEHGPLRLLPWVPAWEPRPGDHRHPRLSSGSGASRVRGMPPFRIHARRSWEGLGPGSSVRWLVSVRRARGRAGTVHSPRDSAAGASRPASLPASIPQGPARVKHCACRSHKGVLQIKRSRSRKRRGRREPPEAAGNPGRHGGAGHTVSASASSGSGGHTAPVCHPSASCVAAASSP